MQQIRARLNYIVSAQTVIASSAKQSIFATFIRAENAKIRFPKLRLKDGLLRVARNDGTSKVKFAGITQLAMTAIQLTPTTAHKSE